MIKHGPVDVIALAAGEPHFKGEVFRTLEQHVSAGIIRVIDAIVLIKDVEGKERRFDIRDLPSEHASSLGFLNIKSWGLFDSDDASKLFEGMVPGSAIVALAIEHVWAADLVNAIQKAGFEMAFHYRVPAMVVDDAFKTH